MIYSINEVKEEQLEELNQLYAIYAEELKSVGLHYDYDLEALESVLVSRHRSKMFNVACVLSDGLMVGFVIGSIHRISGEYKSNGEKMTGYLNDVFVLPDYRKSGMAKSLVTHTEDWIKSCGIGVMELQVVKNNEKALEFWKNQGAEPVGVVCYKKL